MLTQIHISNLATIEKTHLDLRQGTTVITGETGAGKSILMDAILIALGGRAASHLIRAQEEKMDIRVCFDLKGLSNLPKQLQEDFDLQDECIIRRTITRDGRSRTFLNDMPISLPLLREFSEALVDIHGQHEHQSLLKPEKQRELLDRFGNHQSLCQQLRQQAEEYRAIHQILLDKQNSSQKREERRDFLRFQWNELDALQLQANEWQALELEHKQLAHADSLLQNINAALAGLSQEEEKNILAGLHHIVKTLEVIKDVNPHIAQWLGVLHTVSIQLDDLSSELRHFLDGVDLNPERLQTVEQRTQIIHDLARKYKVTPSDLPAFIEKLRLELDSLENNEQDLLELQHRQEDIAKTYIKLGNQLSEKRNKAGKKLAKEITEIIQSLALPHAEFHIELQKEEVASFSPHGFEKISFLVKTNRGSDLLPLVKIASGGELSRISLAIHLATAEQHTIPTLIFDEVDVGIGGGTAELVGKLLQRLGKTHQVICITHLPQVAVYGDQHFAVEKTVKGEQTYTGLRSLSIKEKVQEIARMLGGIQITPTTLKHAEELLAGTG